jgi:hypothetical protein
VAELQRTKGEFLLLDGTKDAARAAEGQFHASIGTAQAQGALCWEPGWVLLAALDLLLG